MQIRISLGYVYCLVLRPSFRLKYVDIKRKILEENMLKKELLDILACPKCKGDLEYDRKNDKLICHACRLKYNIKDDIPIMLIDEAETF